MILYQYRILDDLNAANGTSGILNSTLDFGKGSAQFRGALLTLFGEPLQKSKYAESAYQYIMEATDEDGNRWILTAYEGPSGPVIGGRNGTNRIRDVAGDLLKLIESTAPSDFEEVVYYEDFNTKITYGCRNGVSYFEEAEASGAWD